MEPTGSWTGIGRTLRDGGERAAPWVERLDAGIHANPRDARGLGGALHVIARQPAGRWLFGAVALGLVAYGVFMLVVARYRRMIVR